MKKKTASQPRLRVGVRSQQSVVGQASRLSASAAFEQEQLLAAIWRTEAAFTVASRTLKDLRAKHHRQCAELAAQLRRATHNELNRQAAKPAKRKQ